MRTLIQVQSIPPRVPPQPVEWFGPMPPIGSEITIVGVKHEVVKYSYDVEYDIAGTVTNPRPEPRYGYMRCTQLIIHLKPKHREPEGNLIASLIGKGQAVKWNKDGSVSGYERRNAIPLLCSHVHLQPPMIKCPDCGLDWLECSDILAALRQAADVKRTGYPGHSAPSSERDKCGDCGNIGVCEC